MLHRARVVVRVALAAMAVLLGTGVVVVELVESERRRAAKLKMRALDQALEAHKRERAERGEHQSELEAIRSELGAIRSGDGSPQQ